LLLIGWAEAARSCFDFGYSFKVNIKEDTLRMRPKLKKFSLKNKNFPSHCRYSANHSIYIRYGEGQAMETWWAELTTTLKVFWGIAIFSTVFFALQTIMTFAGLSDMDSDMDDGGDVGDHDAPSMMDYFTVRNLVAFFLGFSWCGIVLIESGSSLGVAIGGGTLMGLALVGITMLILKILASLKSDGTMSLVNAIGHEGLVTISIPADKHHHGKVGISFQNRYRELEGVSDGQQELIKGTRVRVVAISGNQLVVKPI
jgi:hypothetical protein